MSNSLSLPCKVCGTDQLVVDGGHHHGSRDGDTWGLRLACGHAKEYETHGGEKTNEIDMLLKALKSAPRTDLASEIERLVAEGNLEELAKKVAENLPVILAAIRK